MSNSSWYRASSPERARSLSEERLILECSELVYEAMDRAGVATKQELAALLGVSKNEVGQRLSGRRNLTIRTLAAMLHVLGAEVSIQLKNDDKATAAEAEPVRYLPPVHVPANRGYRAAPVQVPHFSDKLDKVH
ncbi:helix-turn-helix domain-containing protein [Gordonia sp. CPCC 205333]|uniref:helix-turn-helix domain-containing protein n=1 Tax=Gordonia sp. CPCC 205333 TaxID=3140790 RepID=UPI003AF33F19